MDKKLTYQDVLDETIEYYKTNPRGYDDENSQCVYLGPNGQMCAVGRCLINPSQFPNAYNAKDLIMDHSMSVFKKEYEHLDDVTFWIKLQMFHDGDFSSFHLKELQEYIESL